MENTKTHSEFSQLQHQSLPVPWRSRPRRCWPAGCRTRRRSSAVRPLRAEEGSWRDPARSSETEVWEEEAATEASLSTDGNKHTVSTKLQEEEEEEDKQPSDKVRLKSDRTSADC